MIRCLAATTDPYGQPARCDKPRWHEGDHAAERPGLKMKWPDVPEGEARPFLAVTNCIPCGWHGAFGRPFTNYCVLPIGHEGVHMPSFPMTPETEKPSDEINHPAHYNSHPSGIECITIAEHHNFNIGNVLKYIWRAGLKFEIFPTRVADVEAANSKASQIKDLLKAQWYLTREIERLQKGSAK